MIDAILGAVPWSAALTVLGAVVAFFLGRRSEQDSQTRRRLEASHDQLAAEREIREADDEALARRITRRH